MFVDPIRVMGSLPARTNAALLKNIIRQHVRNNAHRFRPWRDDTVGCKGIDCLENLVNGLAEERLR